MRQLHVKHVVAVENCKTVLPQHAYGDKTICNLCAQRIVNNTDDSTKAHVQSPGTTYIIRMRTTISPVKWQPWTAVSTLLFSL